MRSWMLALGLLTLVGCARDEALQDEWQTFLDEHQSCEIDADCAVVYPGCPLGCSNPVQSSALDEAEALAEQLIRRYERGGRSCAFDCLAAGEPVCSSEGRCELSEPDTGL